MIDEAKNLQRQKHQQHQRPAKADLRSGAGLSAETHSLVSPAMVCEATKMSYLKATGAVREYNAHTEHTFKTNASTTNKSKKTTDFMTQQQNDTLCDYKGNRTASDPMLAGILEDDLSPNPHQNPARRAIPDAVPAEKQPLLFVQGEAGTGKSLIIPSVVRDVNAICKSQRGVARMSFTAVSTENQARGPPTIRKALCKGLKRVSSLGQLGGKRCELLVDRFRDTRVFFIDEISVVPPQLFPRTSQRPRQLAQKLWSIQRRGLLLELDTINGLYSGPNDSNENDCAIDDDNDDDNNSDGHNDQNACQVRKIRQNN